MITRSLSILVTRIVMIGLGVVTSVILARSLGPEGKGIHAVILFSAGTFSLFYRFGADLSIVFFFKKKKYSQKDLLFNIWIIYATALITSIPVYYLTFELLNSNWLKDINLQYFILSIFIMVFSLFEIYLQRILLAVQKIKLMNLNLIFDRTLFLIILVVLYILDRFTIETVLIADIIKRIIVYITSSILITKEIGLSFNINFRLVKDFFIYGIKSYIAGLVDFFISRLDMILIIGFLDKTYVGLYSIALLSEKFLAFPQSIGFAWMSEISNENDRTIQICRVSFFVMLVLAFPVILFADPLIHLLYSGDFAGSIQPFRFLIAGIVFVSIAHVIKPAILINMEKPLIISFMGTIVLIIDAVLIVIFIEQWKIAGAAAATMIGYFLYSIFLLQYYSAKNKIPLSKLLLVRKNDLILLKDRLWVKIK